ncbi:hypothetical protein [Streptomyces flaveolus]|uniref:hypothetical protein n=1 Tax=Streptomyces flaveolus TaxID=67297 RepID=UPI00167008C2|nr:hypothetical protein [Streptomyces flaveolus]
MTDAPGGLGSGRGAVVFRVGAGAEDLGVFAGAEGRGAASVRVGAGAVRPGVGFGRAGGGAEGRRVVFGVRPAVGVAAVVRGSDVVGFGRGVAPAREGGAERSGVARGVRAAVGATALARGPDGVGSRRGVVPGREGAAEEGDTAPAVRLVVGAAVLRGRDVRSSGAGGRGPAGVVGAGFEVRDGLGRAVLDVSGVDVRDGSGASVGRERSDEADGDGRGVPSSCATHAHTPAPPRTRTAAPPAIHGARRGGRR